MTYLAMALLVALAFVVGRYVGLAKARRLAGVVREARARGLVPEMRNHGADP